MYIYILTKSKIKKIQLCQYLKKIIIGPIIRIGREIQCLPYAGFFYEWIPLKHRAFLNRDLKCYHLCYVNEYLNKIFPFQKIA